ncbi:tetratricopeptide repeat protein [Kitasatospora purpeofusca]|uniref:AfsR/SARP family transcriptional regulator n=1 Tax=Kitasatospora purpeofusca TaxID=67352 RepID=UPI002251A89A|nr:BTAD domain-containing putative transcriptional regulator [Kitasatospora purpeofusca]MCX4683095.1 tetratricopeptide repeat protein [Kitasatospora purpeofusca]
MEFRILGALEVRAPDSTVLAVGGRRQQALLAFLVAHPGRIVSVPRLVDAIWDESPPATADRQVRNMVGLLRRILGGGPGRVSPIRTDGPGYLFGGPEVRIDVQQFTALVDAAAQPGADRVARLREALALWRGPALDGLPGRALSAVAAGLEERRMTVLERLYEAESAAGRDELAITELTELVVAFPLRDGLVRHLLTALARCGRHVEGLAAYRRYADRLAEELGLDPSPRLRALQRELLGAADGDRVEAGLAEPPARVPAPYPRPAQLPWDLPFFIGRTAQLAAMDRYLAGTGTPGTGGPGAGGPGTDGPHPTSVLVITGIPGGGKSTLAVRWSHRAREHFPDGQLFADLHGWSPAGRQDPHAVLGAFLRALGVPAEDVPGRLDEAAALYRTTLAGRRVLIVLDNALDAEQVRPLLPGTGRCAVVVTSRDRLTGLVVREGAERIELADFSPAEGRALLHRVLGAERVAAHEHAVTRLLDACGHLPLAVGLAVARLRDRPQHDLTGLAAELAAEGTRLDVLDADGDGPSVRLRTVFALSYRALDEGAARLFRLLATSPAVDLSAPVAEVVGGQDAAGSARVLRRLANSHLLTEHAAGRYRFHDLVRLFAAERGRDQESESSRDRARDRWYAWCLHQSAAATGPLLAPRRSGVPLPPPPEGLRTTAFDGAEEALRWYDGQRANLLATVGHAFEHRNDEVAWKLPALVWPYLHRSGRHAERLALGRTALAAARRLDDPLATGRTLNDQGHAWSTAGDLPRARRHYEQALDQVRAAGAPAVEGQVLANLGGFRFFSGDHAEAAEHFEDVLRLLPADGPDADDWTVRLCEVSLASVHAFLGRFEAARARAERLLAPELGLHDGILGCSLRNVLGVAHYAAGRPDEALRHFARSLAVSRRTTGFPDQQANSLAGLAAAQQALGRPAAARRSWTAALDLYRQLPAHYRAPVTLLTSLGFTPPDTDSPTAPLPTAPLPTR